MHMLQRQCAVHRGNQSYVLIIILLLLLLFSFCLERSSILTGKFVHNHGTYENSVGAGCDSQSWRDRNEHSTIGTYMTKAGYKTGLFGIYSSVTHNYTVHSIGYTSNE